MTSRSRARALAAKATVDDPSSWFDVLYREAEAGLAVVPWADLVPNPHLVQWLDGDGATPPIGRSGSARALAGAPARALDVGCGYGDNADALAARGFSVDAFDVSEAAVAHARSRFEDRDIAFRAASLLSPPEEWRGVYDLVVEVYTLQVLPAEPRARALEHLASFVARSGHLLIVARGRDDDTEPGALPWPLTREELGELGRMGLSEVSFEDFLDDEEPPVRRFRALYRRD